MNKKFDAYEFRPEHALMLEPRDEDKGGFLALENIEERLVQLKEVSQASWTFAIDGVIIFCAGYHELWPGVVEGWMFPSKQAKDELTTFAFILKSFFDKEMVDREIHRFQTVSPDDAVHARFMEYLGFKKEGTMKNFTQDKKDYCMYARQY